MWQKLLIAPERYSESRVPGHEPDRARPRRLAVFGTQQGIDPTGPWSAPGDLRSLQDALAASRGHPDEREPTSSMPRTRGPDIDSAPQSRRLCGWRSSAGDTAPINQAISVAIYMSRATCRPAKETPHPWLVGSCRTAANKLPPADRQDHDQPREPRWSETRAHAGDPRGPCIPPSSGS